MKIELKLLRAGYIGGAGVTITLDGSFVESKMLLAILEEGIDKCNENIDDKYDLF